MICPLTLFDMGGHEGSPNRSFVVVALMIMKFDTSIKLEAVYTMVTKNFAMSLLLRNI